MTPIDEVLEKLAVPEKTALERIRRIVHETAPGAQEVISYGIPAFKYKGAYLVGFCAYKKHLSLFPAAGPIEALKDKLDGFKCSKGTIQFTIDNQIPEPLIKEIVRIRLADIAKR
jgi:uncharacterized protein YdhG (YjbR/CyaY superfamily)